MRICDWSSDVCSSDLLVLADEVRSVFAMGPVKVPADSSNSLRLALSSEGLKTTTRMMHILAWLINQRAHFSGEMSEENRRRHGRLPPDRPSTDEDLDRKSTRMNYSH